jgi:hypothetical protein
MAGAILLHIAGKKAGTPISLSALFAQGDHWCGQRTGRGDIGRSARSAPQPASPASPLAERAGEALEAFQCGTHLTFKIAPMGLIREGLAADWRR